MNINMKLLIALITSTLFLALPAEAQRGGRGGGGFRGGGGGFSGRPGAGFRPSRPSGSFNRPGNIGYRPQRPAMGRRPSQLPAVRPGMNPGRRPIDSRGPGFTRPRPGQLPARPGGRPNTGIDFGRHLGNTAPGTLPGRPGYRPGYGGFHRGEFNHVIPRHFPYHPIYGYPFGRPWFNRWNWHYNNWPIWTVAATGAAIARWIGVGGYTGYGYAEPISYYPTDYAPQDVYDTQIAAAEECVSIGSSAQVSDDASWQNIGTFGLVPPGQEDMTLAVQLATTKDGMVRGLQWDSNSDNATEVEGSIDQNTLRIAWQEKGNRNALYFETNVDQLTQEESFVNVYNPKTKSLISWQAMRIEESDLPARN